MSSSSNPLVADATTINEDASTTAISTDFGTDATPTSSMQTIIFGSEALSITSGVSFQGEPSSVPLSSEPTTDANVVVIPNNDASTSLSQSSSSIGPIVGAAIGAVVAIALVLILLLLARQKSSLLIQTYLQ